MSKVLTVAIPSYNAEIYLDKCLSSFIDEDILDKIEILIINDGSTDGTTGKAEIFTTKYPDTFRLINKQNGGHGSAVNAGIENATGKYFRVVDADDWVETTTFKELIKYMEQSDADLISTSYCRVNMETGEKTPVAPPEGIEYCKIYSFGELADKNFCCTIHSTSYKTKLLQDNNIRLQHHTFFVDVEYQIFPVPFIDSIVFLNLFVYQYLVGNVSQSTDIKNMVRRYDHHDRVAKSIIAFMNTSKLSEGKYRYAESLTLELLNTNYYISLFYDEDRARGQKLTKEFDRYLLTKSPELYKKLMHRFRMLSEAKKYDFDTVKMYQSPMFRFRKYFRKLYKILIGKTTFCHLT